MDTLAPAPMDRLKGLGLLVFAGSLLLCAFLALVAGAVRSARHPAPGDALSFESGGRRIEVQRFQPDRPGKYPVVVFLHGADGMTMGRLFDDWYLGHCEALAKRGYVVVLPHYMEGTSTKAADLAAMVAHFEDWMHTVGDAVTFASKQPNADPDRIGLCGASLGGALALANSAFDPRVKATVDFFGPMPPKVPELMKRMPPVLVLQGGRDPIVNVREAYRVQKLLADRGWPCDLHVYPRQGHGFFGPADRDSMDRTADFFDRHLKANHPLSP